MYAEDRFVWDLTFLVKQNNNSLQSSYKNADGSKLYVNSTPFFIIKTAFKGFFLIYKPEGQRKGMVF